MNCSTFKNQLEESIENRSTIDSPEFVMHRKKCQACTKLWQSSQMLDYAIDQWNKEVFQIDFVDRVLFHMDKFRSDSPDSLKTDKRKNGSGNIVSLRRTNTKNNLVAICAAVLVMISTVFLIQSPSNNADIASNNLEEHSPASDKNNMELDIIIRDVGSAYLSLANDTALSVSDAMTIVSLNDRSKSDQIKTDRQSQYQWIKSLGTDLKPIQNDLGEAMDFLYESLPEDSPSTI